MVHSTYPEAVSSRLSPTMSMSSSEKSMSTSTKSVSTSTKSVSTSTKSEERNQMVRKCHFWSSSFASSRNILGMNATILCTFVMLVFLSFGSVFGDTGHGVYGKNGQDFEEWPSGHGQHSNNIYTAESASVNKVQMDAGSHDGAKTIGSSAHDGAKTIGSSANRYIQSKVPMMPSMALTSPGRI